MAQALLHLFIALCVTVLPAFTQMARAQATPPVRYATPGGAATGEILKEDGDELQLNVTPCAAQRVVVIFRKPYTKDSAGTVQCGGTTKPLVQAIQR